MYDKIVKLVFTIILITQPMLMQRKKVIQGVKDY